MKEPIADLPESNHTDETQEDNLRKELGTDFCELALELL